MFDRLILQVSKRKHTRHITLYLNYSKLGRTSALARALMRSCTARQRAIVTSSPVGLRSPSCCCNQVTAETQQTRWETGVGGVCFSFRQASIHREPRPAGSPPPGKLCVASQRRAGVQTVDGAVMLLCTSPAPGYGITPTLRARGAYPPL